MNTPLPEAVSQSWLALQTLVRQYPHQWTAALSALLIGATGAAYGVAALGPDAAAMPVQEVTEAVTSLPLQAQLDALEAHSFNLFRSELTRSTDSAQSLLKRLGIADPAAATFLRNDALTRQALFGRAGRAVTAQTDSHNRLLQLSLRWGFDESNFQRLVVEKTPAGFVARIEQAPYTASIRLAGGVIASSLFAATDEQRIPDAVATQLAEIFAGDIDFHRALRKGDRFSVVYETLQADTEPVRSGRVLSAEFVNRGKTYQAMWFQEPGQKGGYYTLDGQSLRRAYLASPMEFSRVTSGFKMRMHPILQQLRAHLGVDYGAPTGTPVRVVGDGVVEFASVQGGYGNLVLVRHASNHSTAYGHLSRIDVKRGQSVSQGQHIGAVGATGWATGPHLHFEFRVNGVHQDPLTLAQQSQSVPVSAGARLAFNQLAADRAQQLAAAALVLPAGIQ